MNSIRSRKRRRNSGVMTGIRKKKKDPNFRHTAEHVGLKRFLIPLFKKFLHAKPARETIVLFRRNFHFIALRVFLFQHCAQNADIRNV